MSKRGLILIGISCIVSIILVVIVIFTAGIIDKHNDNVVSKSNNRVEKYMDITTSLEQESSNYNIKEVTESEIEQGQYSEMPRDLKERSGDSYDLVAAINNAGNLDNNLATLMTYTIEEKRDIERYKIIIVSSSYYEDGVAVIFNSNLEYLYLYSSNIDIVTEDLINECLNNSYKGDIKDYITEMEESETKATSAEETTSG